jgi:DNA-binding transcriptional LysR family regulator
MDSKLKAFFIVAKMQNITAAARHLNMTQPALSKIIKRLELDYGSILMDRLPRGIQLTAFGEVLFDYARTTSIAEFDCRRQLDLLQKGEVELRIGAGALWGFSAVPTIIIELRKQYPKIRINLTVGTKELLLPKLVSGSLDIALIGNDALNEPDIEKHFLTSTNIVAVCRRDHPLQSIPDLAKNDLNKYEWVSYISGKMHNKDSNHPPAITTSSWTTGIILLSQSYSIMGIPEQLLEIAGRFDVIPIPGLKPIRQINGYFWGRKAAFCLPVVQDLLRLAKAQL